MRGKRLALAAVTAFGALGYGIEQTIVSQDRVVAVHAAQLSIQIVRDGFDTAQGRSVDEQNEAASFSSLRLGKCVFEGVGAKAKLDHGTVTELSDYTIVAGTRGAGKFEATTLVLHFENADQLQAELPQYNCRPK